VLVIVLLVALIASAQRIASFYTDFLWFSSVGFSSVWSKMLTVQVGLSACFTLVLFALLWGNLRLADRLAPSPGALPVTDELVARWHEVVGGRMPLVRLAIAAAFALIGGVSAHTQWDNWLLFSNAEPFTSTSAPWKGLDPLNHMNDGFYVFRLPFLDWLVTWAFSALVITLLLCLVAHYLNGGIRPHSAVQRVSAHVKAHISVLLAALALVEGVSYYLQRLALVLATNSLVDGATYKDVHAVRPALFLLVAISVIAAGLFLYNVRQQGWLLPVVAVALWGLVWVLVANAYPAVIQGLVVDPALNVKEAPYIQDNMTATTAAYKIATQNVATQAFQGTEPVTASQVTGKSLQSQADEQSLANIALLDSDLGGMGSVFTKEQGFRNYYSMSGPSTDRYDLYRKQTRKAQATQVLISARDLSSQGAPGNWVSQSLQYTHGYGAVVVPANQAGVDPSDGYPAFVLSNLPPTGQPSIASQPRVYFDTSPQSTSGYVIANSDQAELDFQDPVTNSETSTHYTGTGGVRAGGLLRRLAFFVRFGEINVLISSQINADSRVIYYRNVVQRLEKVAPFLSYDSDPYPVITNGRLYWVVDAYTTTDNFPYSEQADTSRLSQSSELANEPFDYVRNSVKAVVDAYNGTIWLFVEDPTDPIIQTYERAFPALFTSMSRANSIIPGITSHWRYPEDIFVVQTNMYTTYHQTNPDVFFTRSQAWDTPANQAQITNVTATTSVTSTLATAPSPTPSGPQKVLPVYELMALPGQTTQSFVLVQPFVPSSSNGDKQNLTAFMTASSDTDDYGDLTVYTIPAGQSLDGPHLVTSAILTNPTISKEISLLNENGSKAELGDVVMTPIGQSLLYTQPLYTESANGLPRLADVIVVYNGIVYDSGSTSLAGALCRVTNADGSRPFASYCSQTSIAAPPTTAPPTTTPPSKGGSQRTTTTAPETTTTTTAPTTSVPAGTTPSPSSLAHDLAMAQRDFALADAALKQGDLGTYQNDISAGEALVALADKLATASETTTTRAHGSPPKA
jgi:hypothetical protein